MTPPQSDPQPNENHTPDVSPSETEPASPASAPGAWSSRIDGIAILQVAVLLVLALASRVLIYAEVENVLHAEDAIQGLIANHVREGELQLFTYGLPYLGTLQAHWIALCFALFGSTAAVLKWAAGVASLLLVVANYLLAREAAGGERSAGFLAGLLTALGPLYLIEWSLRPRGGYVDAVTLSAFALWALLKALHAARSAQRGRHAAAWLALCGLLLGVGLWVHLTMFYTIGVCLLGLVVWGGRLRASTRAWMLFAGFFAVGSLPFWLFNARYPLRTFFFMAAEIGLPSNMAIGAWFKEVMGVSLPIVFGSRQTMATAAINPVLDLLAWAVWIVLMTVVVLGGRNDRVAAGSAPQFFAPRPVAVRLLLLLGAVTVLVFLFGPFSRYGLDPRPLLPLYAALPPLAAVALLRLWRSGGKGQIVAIATAIVLLIVHILGCRAAERDVVQPTLRDQVIPADLEPFRAFLDSQDIHHVYTNFYIGYRLAFETNERIIPCTDHNPFSERYTPYAEEVRETSDPVGIVVTEKMGDWVRADLNNRGIDYREDSLRDFSIFYSLGVNYPDYPPGPKLCLPVEIEVGAMPDEVRTGEFFALGVTVINRSSIPWPGSSNWRHVWLSYHLIDPETGQMLRFENRRVSLGPRLDQGESVTVEITIEAPRSPGRYALVPDLVIEGVTWFSQMDPSLLDRPHWREFAVIE